MKKNKTFFIASTGTEIGKTYVSVNIIKELLKMNKKVLTLKPILSGFDFKNIHDCDTAKLLKANNMEVNLENIKLHTPWLFERAIAPTLAAEKENKSISFLKLMKWITIMVNRNNIKPNSFTLIEGAGGIMVPIQNKNTFTDLIRKLNIPVVLVVGNYLGTISHTLSVIKVLESINIKIICIILNQSIKNNVSMEENEYVLRKSLINKIKIHKIYHNNSYLKPIVSDIISFF